MQEKTEAERGVTCYKTCYIKEDSKMEPAGVNKKLVEVHSINVAKNLNGGL